MRLWDVTKSMSAIDEPETCPDCQNAGMRRISRTHFYGAGDWNNQQWNPGLGCYTKSNGHARQIAKNRGLEEVGNEKVETIHKTFEKQRDDTRERRWQEADREKVYD